MENTVAQGHDVTKEEMCFEMAACEDVPQDPQQPSRLAARRHPEETYAAHRRPGFSDEGVQLQVRLQKEWPLHFWRRMQSVQCHLRNGLQLGQELLSWENHVLPQSAGERTNQSAGRFLGQEGGVQEGKRFAA